MIMTRVRKEFNRKSANRDARLFVIAAEGQKTETKYFNDLKRLFRNPRIQVEVLQRPELQSSHSSPRDVITMLDGFRREYKLKADDELWLLIDRDRQSWNKKQISEIAQLCHQKKYFLALSNPCFELWLLLHVKDFSEYSTGKLDELFRNPKVNKKRNLIEKEIIHATGSHNKSSLNTKKYMTKENILRAIEQAKELDETPEDRWPEYLATRIYQLIEKLIE